MVVLIHISEETWIAIALAPATPVFMAIFKISGTDLGVFLESFYAFLTSAIIYTRLAEKLSIYYVISEILILDCRILTNFLKNRFPEVSVIELLKSHIFNIDKLSVLFVFIFVLL
jgi:hypothetical protein